MIPPHPVPAGFAASIFDMDGLLIDSEILWHEAEIEILGGLGVPLAVDGCRSTKGMFVDEVRPGVGRGTLAIKERLSPQLGEAIANDPSPFLPNATQVVIGVIISDQLLPGRPVSIVESLV